MPNPESSATPVSVCYNALPEGHDGPQKRRTDFADLREKLRYDALNLIALAQKVGREKGVMVAPLMLATRHDDDFPALGREISLCLKGGLTGEVEFSAEDELPRLQPYKRHWDKWTKAEQAQFPWRRLKALLLANGAEYLKLAENLEGGGALFGLDEIGYVLLCDKQPEKPGGTDYVSAKLHWSKTDNGYRNNNLFPFDPEHYAKIPPEFIQYERFTGQPFGTEVKNPEKTGENYWGGVWLECGDKERGDKTPLYIACLVNGQTQIKRASEEYGSERRRFYRIRPL